MTISIAIKQLACEKLFHFHPKKTIARELAITSAAVRDWRFFMARSEGQYVVTCSWIYCTPRDHDQ